ncbi:MAG: holo-ACP synthase [Deltaproteobacteria bacterium]|nr:holo-ACP synthase [Deltaproteobacteria bacterium]MCL5277252.1 holo-ACP synthase [Deltaproteobacteria bacterium]
MAYHGIMEVLGLGIDIVQVARVRRLLGQKGDRFVQRVFTDDERRYCEGFRNRAERYAARFAAKEAVRKAISPLYKGYYSSREIEITRRADGMPGVKLHGKLSVVGEKGVGFLLSMSHERDYAIAVVIMQKGTVID